MGDPNVTAPSDDVAAHQSDTGRVPDGAASTTRADGPADAPTDTASSAYASYRRGRVPLMSSVFAPFFRDGRTDSAVGKIIDILAIFATLFGTVASLGLGALQIRSGLNIVAGWSSTGNGILVGIIGLKRTS